MEKKTIKLSLRIILAFSCAILLSIIPDQFPRAFGDWYCTNTTHIYGGDSHSLATWHWGYRHWLYFLMGFCLFVIQVIDMIKEFNKEK